MAQKRDIEYLRRVLRMNPVMQSEEMLAERANYLADGAGDVLANELATREELSERIENLREDFWLLKDDNLLAKLQVLDAERFPDLEVSIERLRKVAVVRDAVEELSQRYICGKQFLSVFREILLAAPRQAAILKSEALDIPVTSPDVRDYSRFARDIRDKFPELFELEQAWLTWLIHGMRRAQRPHDADDDIAKHYHEQLHADEIATRYFLRTLGSLLLIPVLMYLCFWLYFEVLT